MSKMTGTAPDTDQINHDENHDMDEFQTILQNLEIHFSGDDDESVKEMLSTTRDEVYQLSPDGKTYISPQLLRGTPVENITENSAYWEPDWKSLDAYLAHEAEEIKLHKEATHSLTLDPNDPDRKKKAKQHADNISKHKKIREVFGPDTPYHPNQIIGKKNMPKGGFCDQESMYKLACKFSDLEELRKKSLLAMEPWDCLRWRILEKAASFQATPASPVTNIKTIVRSIANEDPEGNSRSYNDPVLRRAVIYSAGLQGQEKSYGPKTKSTSSTAARGGKLDAVLGRTSRVNRRTVARSVSPKMSTSVTPASSSLALQLRKKKKVQETRKPEYTGIDAYRAAMAQRKSGSM